MEKKEASKQAAATIKTNRKAFFVCGYTSLKEEKEKKFLNYCINFLALF